MKKYMTIFIISVLAVIGLSACSKFTQDSQPANGIFIIGNEQDAVPVIDRYKDNIKTKTMFQ